MAKDLKNKIIVVTGGAAGLGRSMVDSFLEKGAETVIMLGVNEKRGIEAAAELNATYGDNKAVFIKCDVTKDLESVSAKIINTYKNVDVLVNNAGVLNELSAKKTIDLNVLALVEWSLKFWEHMRIDKNGAGGTNINIASICGYRNNQYTPIYNASKYAVIGFTRSLGHTHNFDRSGVRVVAICPGFTETPIVADVKLWDEELNEKFVTHMRNQMWQKPDDVGRAAVEVFETADSGTAWLIEGGRPITEV